MARRETERDTYGGERRWAEGAGESWTSVEKTGPRQREGERDTDPESARWRGSEASASPSEGTLRKITDELGITEPAPTHEQTSQPAAAHEHTSDERIREAVCERLLHEPDVDISEVSVEVSAAIVTLEGTVPYRQMKHAIEDIVATCRDVIDVENRIRVARDDG
jgi:osmotically-inducible protein OsmY